MPEELQEFTEVSNKSPEQAGRWTREKSAVSHATPINRNNSSSARPPPSNDLAPTPRERNGDEDIPCST